MTRLARRRWATAAELLQLVNAEPGITRREAAERLGLSSGAATELVDRLKRLELLNESRAEHTGPGRPTTILEPHEQGPLVLIIGLRASGWELRLSDLAGRLTALTDAPYEDDRPEAVLTTIAAAVAGAVDDAEPRIRCVVVSAAGPVSGTALGQLSARHWLELLDLQRLTAGIPAERRPPLLVGNDATLAGVAEARTGASKDTSVAVHLMVATGIGGVLLLNGEPALGAHGTGGEFGHLPFADPALECTCGSYGCWDLAVDGRALARHRGEPEPADPEDYARRLLDDLESGRSRSGDNRGAVALAAGAFGRGIAGLVNAHDPDVITLGGLGPQLRRTAPEAFDRAYRSGLMTVHQRQPPPVLDSVHGADGPTRGAAYLGIDHITSPAALDRWAGNEPETDTAAR
ncbi:ROK family transcriptional regulator [Microlunatus elymi]|uniref:ROK family transcriptional regulator n=1 Tax=Microlunatus elymi TaxID=2596828 RepID=UPI001D18EA09|nr:ROK family transcriptional regulator [Microlunatus elymi]